MGNQDSMSHLLSGKNNCEVGVMIGRLHTALPVVEEAPDQAAPGCGRAAMIIDMR